MAALDNGNLFVTISRAGYRLYFGKDGETVVVLLGGSSKQRQGDAIAVAKERWADYKRRKAAR